MGDKDQGKTEEPGALSRQARPAHEIAAVVKGAERRAIAKARKVADTVKQGVARIAPYPTND